LDGMETRPTWKKGRDKKSKPPPEGGGGGHAKGREKKKEGPDFKFAIRKDVLPKKRD